MALLVLFGLSLASVFHGCEGHFFACTRNFLFNAIALPLAMVTFLVLLVSPAKQLSSEALTSFKLFAVEYQIAIVIVSAFIELVSNHHKASNAGLEASVAAATASVITIIAYSGSSAIHEPREAWIFAEFKLIAVIVLFWFLGRFANLVLWQGPADVVSISPIQSPVKSPAPVESAPSSPALAPKRAKSPSSRVSSAKKSPKQSALFSDSEDGDDVAQAVKTTSRVRKSSATPPARRRVVKSQLDTSLQGTHHAVLKLKPDAAAGPRSPGVGVVSARLRARAQTPKW